MNERVVSIFGTGRAQPGDPAFVLAEQVGRALAQAGFILANGGYGVTCRAFKNSVANEFVTREVVTDTLQERLHNLIKVGRAYVMLPGGTGTLLELAAVWELKNKGFLDRARPLIFVGDFWRPVVELVAADDPRCRERVTFVGQPSELPGVIENALGL